MRLPTLFTIAILAGCATNPNAPERGRDGTIGYNVSIETDPPGMRIEMDNDFVGTSPTSIKIFGDRDGTFHNWGAYEVIIKAFPPAGSTNLFQQTKIFRTGGWFSQEDRIPNRLFFDMHARSSTEVTIPSHY